MAGEQPARQIGKYSLNIIAKKFYLKLFELVAYSFNSQFTEKT